ncbi:MAG: hypothetical protein ACYTDT_06615 [Planctomycetota bacterium]
MRTLAGFIVFFSIGLFTAGVYFYRLHPDASFSADIPRMRKDIDDAMERGKRLKDAWDDKGGDDPIAGTQRKDKIQDKASVDSSE